MRSHVEELSAVEMGARAITELPDLTNSNSRIRNTNIGFIQGFNGQLIVDEAHQIILAADRNACSEGALRSKKSGKPQPAVIGSRVTSLKRSEVASRLVTSWRSEQFVIQRERSAEIPADRRFIGMTFGGHDAGTSLGWIVPSRRHATRSGHVDPSRVAFFGSIPADLHDSRSVRL